MWRGKDGGKRRRGEERRGGERRRGERGSRQGRVEVEVEGRVQSATYYVQYLQLHTIYSYALTEPSVFRYTS